MVDSEYVRAFYQCEIDNAKFLSRWLNSHIEDFMNDGMSLDRLSTLSSALLNYRIAMENLLQK